MTGYRITKLVCPSCKGKGESDLFDLPCFWCRGRKRIKVSEALRYADISHAVGIGGYIAGDHDQSDMQRMKDEAEHIYKCAEQAPPWRATA